MRRATFFICLISVFFFVLGVTFINSTQTALAAGKVIKWKLQAVYPSASPSYQGSTLVVIDKIKKRTNGRLVIEPFTAGALVPSKEIYNAVQRGMIQAGMGSANYLRDRMPVMTFAASICFNFTEVWQGQYLFKQLGLEDILREESLKHGVYYFSDRIYPTELVCKKPITKLDDFKGLKLRSSGAIKVFLTQIGAAASYITGAEVYPSLASGVIDGAHWGAAQGADKMGFYEICKYHLKPSLNMGAPDAWFFNKKKFDALPKDIQKIALDTLEEHFWYRSNEYIYLEGKALAKALKERGVKISMIEPAEQVKIRKLAQAMWLEESKKSPASKKAYDIMIGYMKDLGLL